ncbi:uncharacterized protein LOC130710699 [Lotus japonicus]|uniref:uncharacterized protein LOC130710699 n=1 Tax=Lotus japonicus TaxID=34305 RepID=UPI0025869B81|nr:uncharacterized protein LOC130710699 [Lotus japonicus]
MDFSATFPSVRVDHMGSYGSDHSVLAISWLSGFEQHNASEQKKRPFRFEEIWINSEECKQLVHGAWFRPGADCVERIQVMKEVLAPFGREQGNLQKLIACKEIELKKLEGGPPTSECLKKKKEVLKEFDDLLKDEEVYWRQRSRALWLKEGDKNTKFFHKKASQRRKHNCIKKMKNEQGDWVFGEKAVAQVIQNHFQQVFSSDNPLNIPDTCQRVRHKLNTDMIEHLASPFSSAEVKFAIDQMHPLKSPGPDGLPALFYQHYWDLVGGAVTNHVLDILNNGKDVLAINDTFICLIPKVSKPQSPKDLRPISLCNVLMKIVTKCIANRLKHILPKLVGETQSAFIPGRLITDNALIGMEVFHYMKKKKHGKQGWMALKLDMSKAYDRIEWLFLRGVLEAMSFPPPFVELILRCITSVRYAILLNGEPQDWFCPQRGLRQGDPISPYLFILCAEVFAGLIEEQVALGNLHGVRIARGAPQISHLFFADDSLLFMRANLMEADQILATIKKYEVASGQRVNFDKTELSFSQNVPQQLSSLIRNRMEVKAVDTHERYLGLPTIIGRSKKAIFSSVQERLVRKLKGWKEKFLSRAGKEVLLKAVAQAIPTYIMSCFKIPDGICDSMASLMSNFWWGQKQNERKIHWMSWSKLCLPKHSGGLGFRDFKCFNEALLAKQVWRLVQNKDSLLYKNLKARYFPRSSILEASVGFRPSFSWRSICAAKDVIKDGSTWKIGNGKAVSIWGDSWLPGPGSGNVLSSIKELPSTAKVDSLIDNIQRSWNTVLVDLIFHPIEAIKIKSIPLAWFEKEDLLVWKHNSSGVFSVRSAYSMLMQRKISSLASSSSTRSVCNFVWRLKVPKKVQHFMYRLLNKSLPCQQNLKRRGIKIEPLCPLCGEHREETPFHLFLNCNWARQVWFMSDLAIKSGEVATELDNWLLQMKEIVSLDVMDQVAMICWSIWKSRNDCIFNKIVPDPKRATEIATSMRLDWLTYQPQNKGSRSVPSDPVWTPPPAGLMKLNFDAGWAGEKGSGFGLVVRNDNGGFQVASSHYEDCRREPLIAEAMCFRWALNLAANWGLDSLVFSSDCQQLVKAFHCPSDFPSLAHIMLDCTQLVNSFRNFSFCFDYRQTNRVAHALAAESHLYKDCEWWGDPPVGIL